MTAPMHTAHAGLGENPDTLASATPGPGCACAHPAHEKLADRLSEPHIAEALNSLLDNVGLLAILVSGLDGLVARGDTILNSLTGAVDEFKGSATLPEGLFPEGKPSVQMSDVSSLVGAGAKALPLAGPALNKTLDSGILNLLTDEATLSPEVQRAAKVILASLQQATADAAAGTIPAATPRNLLKELRDPDLARGMGYMIHLLQLVGRDIGGRT